MDLINEIRRKNGYDPEMLKRVAQDREIEDSMQSMTESLGQAMKNLSDEIYTKSTHFLFEFVQNADDNDYPDNTVPALHMRVEDNQASFHCNEVGFTAKNVEAICKVGASTKENVSAGTRYIGEKGIGFKSVFKVADVVFISSGQYTFKLDKGEKLGMITPIWAEEYPVEPGWTSFHLKLTRNTQELVKYMEDIKPSILLFLSKLRSLKIQVSLQGVKQNIQIYRHDPKDGGDTDIIRLDRILDSAGISSDYYLMVKHVVKADRKEPTRNKIRKSEIVLAFPITSEGVPVAKTQDVHAFLPLRNCGFNFIIQADFLTSTNREDILSDKPWNTSLRLGVVEAFLRAIEQFKQRPSLEYAWLKYIPNAISDSFFSTFDSLLQKELQNTRILRSTDGTYQLPSEVYTVPAKFRDGEGIPLIAEKHLPLGQYYLSLEYDNYITNDSSLRFVLMDKLGVRELHDEMFIQLLKQIESEFHLQTDDWHEEICAYLNTNLKLALKHQLWMLRILPLSNGAFISSRGAGDIFFNFEDAASGIPGDLQLHCLKAGLRQYPARYRLYQSLGVKEADRMLIARKILSLHGSPGYKEDNVGSLIHHAQFMFVNCGFPNFPLPTNLRIMDDSGKIGLGVEMYMDLPSLRLKLHNILPSPARFIHPDYLRLYPDQESEDWSRWRKWLQCHLSINVSPRLIDGELSLEFEAMVKKLESKQLLLVLQAHWQYLEGRLSLKARHSLGQTITSCEDGSAHPLGNTFIKRTPLMQFDVPFLPIDDPEEQTWDFLENLGVSTKVDGIFYLKRLLGLQKIGCMDELIIKDVYKELQARFEDNPDGIRGAFRREPVFFASQKGWTRFENVVWSGPRAMRLKVSLKAIFPSLEDLFRSSIRVNDPSDDALVVAELLAIAEESKGQIITETVKEHAVEMLLEASALIRRNTPNSAPPAWLELLRGQPIFPVDSPSEGLILCKAGDRFYVSDSPAYEDMFLPLLPILSIQRNRLHLVKHLLDSVLFTSGVRYLEGSIRRTSVPGGYRFLNNAATKNYASRLGYIRRFVEHLQQPEPSSEVMKRLQSMRDIAVYSVDSVKCTYSVDDVKSVQPDSLAIEQGQYETTILISKTCLPQKWDLYICERLAKLLEIPKDKLGNIILYPIEAIDDWLDFEGVPNVSSNPTVEHDDYEEFAISASALPVPAAPENTDLVNENGPVFNPLSESEETTTENPLASPDPSSIISERHGPSYASVIGYEPVMPIPQPTTAIPPADTTNADDPWLAIRSFTNSAGFPPGEDLFVGHSQKSAPGQFNSSEPGDFQSFQPLAYTGGSHYTAANYYSQSDSLNQPYFQQPFQHYPPAHHKIRVPLGFSEPHPRSYLDGVEASQQYPGRGNFQNTHFINQTQEFQENQAHLAHGIYSETSGQVGQSGMVPSHESAGFAAVAMPILPPSWGGQWRIHRPSALERSPMLPISEGENLIEVSAYEQENGLIGEFLVYNLLVRDLPDFGPENWTSELRGLADGFQPYQGYAVADFVYHDTQGALTALWCGTTRNEWTGKWPIYHIEVKSTSGDVVDPFHMSVSQLVLAKNFTILDEIPAELYVLLRVSGVRTALPSFDVYMDPHRGLYDGGLRIVKGVAVSVVL